MIISPNGDRNLNLISTYFNLLCEKMEYAIASWIDKAKCLLFFISQQ